MLDNTTDSPTTNVSESFYFHYGAIGFQVALCLVQETLGNFLLLAFILYEKYGMDPQKRTVSNQLLSSICAALILFNISIVPVWCISRFGAYQHVVPRVLLLFGVHGTILFCILASTEMVIMKLIYIYHFSKISQTNEYFITLILTIFNSLFVVLMLSIRLASGEYYSAVWKIWASGRDDIIRTSFDKKVNFWVVWFPVLLCFTIYAIGIPLIFFKKWKAKRFPTQIIPLTTLTPTPTPTATPNVSKNEVDDEQITRIDMEQDDQLEANHKGEEQDVDNFQNVGHHIIHVEEYVPVQKKALEQGSDQIQEQHQEQALDQSQVLEQPEQQEPIEQRPVPPPLQFNNGKFNENLVNYVVITVLFLSFSTIAIPCILVAVFDLDFAQFAMFFMYLMYNALTIGFPALFFLQNPRRLDSILELF